MKTVRSNWEWALVVAVTLIVISAWLGGFADGGDGLLGSWWDGGGVFG